MTRFRSFAPVVTLVSAVIAFVRRSACSLHTVSVFTFLQATFKGWIEIMYDAIDSREVRHAPMFAHARLVVPL